MIFINNYVLIRFFKKTLGIVFFVFIALVFQNCGQFTSEKETQSFLDMSSNSDNDNSGTDNSNNSTESDWDFSGAIFASGFKGVSTDEVYTSDKQLTGIDAETGFDWTDLSDSPIIDYWKLQYVAYQPYEDVAKTEILPEFMGKEDVLHLQVKGNDTEKSALSRNELQIFPKSAVENNMQVYVRYLMYLPEYRDQLESSGGTHINMLELKDRGTSEISGFSWRFNINIRLSDENIPYWHLKKEYKIIGRDTRDDGSIENRDVTIPLDEWFQVELFFKKDVNQGRIWFAVNEEAVFDFNGRTLHPDPDKRQGISFFSPFKNYRGGGHIYPYSQYYDNLEVWTDFPRNIAH